METNEITREVIGAAMSVHSSLGPGLLESAYRVCLCHELALRGIAHKEEVLLPITYKGLTVDVGYRVDVVIENLVIVELKATGARSSIAVLLANERSSGRPPDQFSRQAPSPRPEADGEPFPRVTQPDSNRLRSPLRILGAPLRSKCLVHLFNPFPRLPEDPSFFPHQVDERPDR